MSFALPALLLLAVGVGSAPAQPAPRVVDGVVVDADTGEAVAGARVQAAASSPDAPGGAVVMTGPDGRFSLPLPDGVREIRVAADGYFQIAANPPPPGEPLRVELRPAQVRESVEVVAEAPAAGNVPAVRLAPEQVLEAPGAVDNVFRALATLPGVNLAEDFGSRLTVRGGTPDQNLTVMDGVEIHNPYRLFGLVSAFNPETVQDFELSASGFGARYGDRLSSLLVIENRSPRPEFSGSASVSASDGNVVLEGPAPGAGAWLLTARRTYYDLIVGRIVEENIDFPAFADVQGEVEWEFGPGHRLSFFGVRSREDADVMVEDEEEAERFDFESDARNDLAAVRLDALFGERVNSTTILSWYRNADVIDFDGEFVDDDVVRDSGMDSLQRIQFRRELTVTDAALRHETGLQLRHHYLTGGLELHRLDSVVDLKIEGERNNSLANPSSQRGGLSLPDIVLSELDGIRGGGWIQDAWQPGGGRFSLESGLRFDWSTVHDSATLSPRLAASFDLGRGFRARAAGGLYTQSVGYEKLIQSDYFLDLTDAREAGLGHERALQLSAGIEKRFGPWARVRFEAYSRRYDDLLVGRLETDAEFEERVARYDFPDSLAGSLPVAPRITVQPVNGGRGTAYGFDLYAEWRDPSSRFIGWGSYAFGRARRETYGVRTPFEYDRPHALNLVGRAWLGRGFALAGTLRAASGFPYTPATGVRVSAEEDFRGRLVPARGPDGLEYEAVFGGVADLNSGRIPAYARLDLRLTWRPGGRRGRFSFYAEVINALDRENPVTIEPQLLYEASGGPPLLEETTQLGFPRIPTAGIRYVF